MAQIRCIVKPDGSVEYDMDGFVGDACYEQARQLAQRLAALGIRLEDVRVSPKGGDDPEERVRGRSASGVQE